jgi:hypothetical protein
MTNVRRPIVHAGMKIRHTFSRQMVVAWTQTLGMKMGQIFTADYFHDK